MSQHNLLPDTESILKRLEEQTGFPVSCVEDPSLKLSATVSMGSPGRPIHIIRFRPGVPSLDYLVAVQAGYALRLFSLPPGKRFQLSANLDRRIQAIADVRRLNPQLEDKLAIELGEQLFDGLMLQARSCPTGILVDLLIFRDYPRLRPQQRQSLLDQCQVNVKCLSGVYDRTFPEQIVKGNRAMNAAHAFFAADLLKEPHLAIPYRAVGLETVALGMLKDVTGQAIEQIDDRELIESWGTQLGIADWFVWLPYD